MKAAKEMEVGLAIGLREEGDMKFGRDDYAALSGPQLRLFLTINMHAGPR